MSDPQIPFGLRARMVEGVARIVAGLWDRESGAVDPSPALRAAILDQFHRLYYSDDGTWRTTKYRGITTWKCPLDLWTYQEIIHEVRPGLVIETGTGYGGSALFFADLCETVGHGEVVTIDIRDRATGVEHPRLTKLLGSSIDRGIRDRVAKLAPERSPVMVILDSEHAAEHVLAELRLWGDLVTQGSYLIVEDTNINGHPVYPGFGPGPAEAVTSFLSERRDFAVDSARHKLLMTWNPGGYLRRSA